MASDPSNADPSSTSRRSVLIGAAYAAATLATGGAIMYAFRSKIDAVKDKPAFRMQSPWVNDAEFIGYFVAIYEGWYGSEGLKMQYLSGGTETIVEGTLLSNQAEIALAPLETVAKLVQTQKAPLVIIGTQYQRSPVGIVSLANRPIKSPKDLIGKKLAVPPANIISVEAMLRLNNIPKDQVQILPYQYDPTPLINGDVDATLDFVTNVPYTIETKGKKAYSFLLYDFGFRVFNDVVVVTKDTLAKRRDDIKAWLKASRRGWTENFRDVEKYPKLFMETWFAKTGRTYDNEVYFNKAQQPLIENAKGIYTMTPEAIAENIATLAQVGIVIDQSTFDTSVLAEI